MPPSPSNSEDHRKLPDLGFVGFWHCDYRTGELTASSTMERLFGVARDGGPRGPHSHADYLRRILPTDAEWLRDWRTSAAQSGEASNVEYRSSGPPISCCRRMPWRRPAGTTASRRRSGQP